MRSVMTREAEWDEQERAWALALADYRASLCPLCGRPLSVCTAPEAERGVEAPLPSRCHYTTAIERRREQYTGTKSTHPGALLFSARPTSLT